MAAKPQVLLALVVIASVTLARADTQTLEVLATVRTNNRTESLVFRVPAHQAHVSALRIRSGTLAVTLAGIEIEFADGRVQRAILQETIPPGHQCRPIPIDPSRAVSRVLVTKRPGLQPGETLLQLLGKVERGPNTR
jgi:hypothetical protein